MNDQNEIGSGTRLRDLLGIAPDGRKIHHWGGLDRDRDIAELTDAIAAAIPDLANRSGQIVQLREGDLVLINMAAFRGLIDKHVCFKQIVNRGGGWEEEFLTYKFAPAARYNPSLSGPQPAADTSAPDAEAIDQIYRHELTKRLPRVK